MSEREIKMDKKINSKFKYVTAAETNTPGYLYQKWITQYPKCFTAPKKPKKVERNENRINT